MQPQQNELLTQEIGPLVWQKSFAMLIGIFAILLFTLVDTWFIALLGTDALAAMSFIMPVTFVVSSFSMGMSMGMASVVGRLLGAQNHQQAKRFTTDGLLLSVVVVALLASLGYWLIDPLFTLLGAKPNILVLIRDYISIWYFAIPLLVIPMVGNAAIRASGDIKTPSIVMLVAGGMNAILDPIFIFVLNFGMQGAAIATAISWFITFVVAAYMLNNKLNLIDKQWPGLQMIAKNWLKLLQIGIPASLSQMLNPLSSSIIIAMLAGFGIHAVAAFGIGARLEALFLILAISFSVIVPTVFGQNYGAKLIQRAIDSIRFSFHSALIVHLGLFIILLPLAPFLAGLFSDDAEVIAIASTYLRIIPLSYGLQAVAMILSAMLNSLHRPFTSLLLNLIRLFVCLLPAAWLGATFWGVTGLFWSITAAHIIAGVLMYLYAQRLFKQLQNEI